LLFPTRCVLSALLVTGLGAQGSNLAELDLAALRDRNAAVLQGILEDAAQARAPQGSLQQKVGDFYFSGMAVRAINQAGLAPLKATLERIAALAGPRDLAVALAQAHLERTGAGFSFTVDLDGPGRTAYIPRFAPGGLGLPDRDGYTAEDEAARLLRSRYLDHLARMFALAGDRPLLAKAHAGIVLAMETRLARAARARAGRDPLAGCQRMTLADLRGAAKGFHWDAYLGTLGLKEQPVLVCQPEGFEAFAAMTADTPLAQWKTYLRWHALNAAAPYLGESFEAERFAFCATALGGAKAMGPRWQRVLAAADQALGEPLGRLYVDRAFPPRARQRALELVASLRAALGERIRSQPGMAEATRAAAEDKLEAMTVKVGYPDHWRSYGGLEVTRDSYAGNVIRARRFDFSQSLARLGKPVDRQRWDLTAPTVAVRYDRLNNELVVPAGILQPPCFLPQGDDPANCGAIGAVIGRELAQGFLGDGAPQALPAIR
jgi:predicted metalloendopeptidase